jgi:hypothetical protein
MAAKTDKLQDYQDNVRELVSKQYRLGYSDAKEDAMAAARDKVLIVGVLCAAFGFAAGLGAAGVLS